MFAVTLFAGVLSGAARESAVHSTPGASSVMVPAPILKARTVFVSNGGADGGMFPEPFSGDPNRSYIALWNELKSVGEYEMVADPAQADLVMEIQLVAPSGPAKGGKQLGAADPVPFLKLVIYDGKTRFALWTITEPIEWAVLQRTHDRNFDRAVARLSADVQALSQPNSGSLYAQPSTRAVPSWQH
ncbi:MAG TPA: hypothetical protein VGL22_02045 [Terracidiphilus sp.]